MTNQKKISALTLATILVAAGCGGGADNQPTTGAVPPAVVAPPAAQPDPGTGVTAPLTEVAEAEAQFLALDKDPAAEDVEELFEDLDLDLEVEAAAGGGGGDGTDAGAALAVESNLEDALDTDQDAPDEDDLPDAAEVDSVRVSSTRGDAFDKAHLADGNPNTAWAPEEDDEEPALTFKLAEYSEIEAMQLKVSPVGVVFDLEARNAEGDFETVAEGLVPKYRELQWINLKGVKTEQLRLRFHAPTKENVILVCEAKLYGEETKEPKATAKPTAKPTVKPSTKPWVKPSATPTPTPSPSATATASPTASPSASPTATPTTSPRPTATPTTSPRPTATPTTSPRPTATPSTAS